MKRSIATLALFTLGCSTHFETLDKWGPIEGRVGADSTYVLVGSSRENAPPYLLHPSELQANAVRMVSASGDLFIVGGLVSFVAFVRTMKEQVPSVQTFALGQCDATIPDQSGSLGGSVVVQDGENVGEWLTFIGCGLAPLDLHRWEIVHATNTVNLRSLDLERR